MGLATLLKTIAAKHMAPSVAKPVRTRTPLRLSQDSAVTISITPLILAEADGALFKSDLPTDHKIIAVGQFPLFGLSVFHAYLSQSEGAFIHIVTRGTEIVETQLYRQYVELEPTSGDEWAFWLADVDGFIGLPEMRSLDTDGSIPYRRVLSGDQRVDPYRVTETLVDTTGAATTIRHRMMHYSRVLKDPKLIEHLLVSAVETDVGASINLWLGLDIAVTDLTVFAAADTPV